MQKLAKHSLTITFLLTIFLVTQTGCRWFQPTAQFFIVNESSDKQAVDFKVVLGGQNIFDDTLRYNNVRPDLRYTPNKTLPKGKYMITVTGDSGKIQVRQPIMLDGNRFIFVTYHYKKPIDSTTLVKRLGFAYPPMLKGQEPKVEIYITDKEPVHM